MVNKCPKCGRDTLSVDYLCERCRTRSIFDALLEQIEKRMKVSGVPPRYLHASLSDFKEEYDTEAGLFIMGPVGCGKTHLLAALCRNHLLKACKCYFINAPLFFADLKANLDKSHDKIKFVSEVPYLFIDDIGAERVTDYVFEIWYRILEARYSNMLYTSVTLNSVDTLDERLFRRLRDSTKLVEMEENEV